MKVGCSLESDEFQVVQADDSGLDAILWVRRIRFLSFRFLILHEQHTFIVLENKKGPIVHYQLTCVKFRKHIRDRSTAAVATRRDSENRELNEPGVEPGCR